MGSVLPPEELMEFMIKKCQKCGAVVEVQHDCTCKDCGINCCGQQMVELKPNSVDASFEKHVPQYEIDGSAMKVFVNHVMEEDHFIEWIAVMSENKITKVFFKPGDNPEAVFHYAKGAKLFAFCNKHGLWTNDVK